MTYTHVCMYVQHEDNMYLEIVIVVITLYKHPLLKENYKVLLLSLTGTITVPAVCATVPVGIFRYQPVFEFEGG